MKNGRRSVPPGMERFFQQFGFGEDGRRMPQQRMPRKQHRVVTGENSGFFISADGYAVTNNHVVDHAELGAGHC